MVLAITVIHYAPWVNRWIHRPADRVFLAIHNSRSDYPVYLDYIQQGLNGNWLVQNSFAIEPQSGTVFYWIFLCFGQVGRFFGITDAQVVYHAATLLVGISWFVLLYALAAFMFKRWQWRILAFGTFLFSTSIPNVVKAGNGWTTQWYMSWWTELDPIHRAYFLPHHVLGHMVVVAVVLLTLQCTRTRSGKWLLGAVPLVIAGGIIHPPSVVILLMILPIYIVLRRRFRLLPVLTFVCVAAVATLLFIQRQMELFPIEVGYESLSFAVSMKEYLLALGPIVVLAFGSVFVVRKKPELLLFMLWAWLSILSVDIARRTLDIPWPLLRQIPISNVRFLQHAVWIPLGVLAVAGLEAAVARFGHAVGVVCLVMVLAVTFIGYPNAYAAYDALLPVANDYDAPRQEWGQGMQALRELPPGPIFAMKFTSTYIPGLAGRFVYFGREFITLQYETKAGNAYTFFRGMDTCEAYDLLKANKFAGVFYGFDEQTAGIAVGSYPFLKPFKSFGSTTIYAVDYAYRCAE